MARPAAAKSEDQQSAALDARLRALFEAVKREPVPSKLLRHVEQLDAGAPRGSDKKR